MSIYRVIDKLESYVKEGTVLPLRYRVLSEERLMEYIEKMRATLPEEVDRAKKITKNQDRVMREAQEKAQAIVTEASSTHSALIDQNEIVRRARTTAETILREAEEKAARTRAGADAYAAQVLAELDNRLSTALGSVKKGLEALAVQQIAAAPQAPKNGAAAPTAPGPLADAAARAKRTAFDAAEETAELESVSPS